jgi:hypothetical protein
VFEYFPGNYVWNLSVVATLNSGGLIDEVDRACRPIREAATRGEDAGTPDFLRAWTALTDQLVACAEEATHERTARQLYARATNYLGQAERMLSNSDPDRLPTYRRVATTPRVRPPSRSASPWSWRGAPTTTGARCSAAASNARANARSRTTGSTSSGCGDTRT